MGLIASTRNWCGVYWQKHMLCLMALGFASGLPLSLTFSTLTVWLTEAGIGKSTIGLFAIVGAPYSLKFLWSHLIDHLPLPSLTKWFGKRRSWILFTQCLLIIALIGMGSSDPVQDALITAIWALLVSVFSASQDIASDAYRIEILEQDDQAAGAAIFVLGYRVGMLVSGAGGLYLATYAEWSTVYSTMAGFMLIGIITVLLMPEPGATKKARAQKKEAIRSWKQRIPHIGGGLALLAIGTLLWDLKDAIVHSSFLTLFGFAFGKFVFWGYYCFATFIVLGLLISILTGLSVRKTVVAPFAEFMQRPGWLLILAFVLLYKFGENVAGTMTNPFLLELGFTKAEIATVVKSLGFGATLAGSFIGGALVKRMGLLPALWLCGILQMVSTLMFSIQAMVGHSLWVLCASISIENLSGGMGTAAFVAYLSYLCNREYTATQYALLSSIMIAAGKLLIATVFAVDQSYFPDGSFIDVIGWSWFFVIATVCAVPGLLLLSVLASREKRIGGKKGKRNSPLPNEAIAESGAEG